jgi:hypothetical protein
VEGVVQVVKRMAQVQKIWRIQIHVHADPAQQIMLLMVWQNQR